MKRRTVLASAATAATGGLAGCLAPVLGNPLPRRLTVAGTEARRLELDAELLEPLVTVDHTARLRVTWSNSGSQKVRLVRVDLPVSEPPDTRQTGLVLARPSYEFADQTWAGCWQLSQFQGPGGFREAELEPNESLTYEYEVWEHPQADDCFSPGRYQFGYFDEGTDETRDVPVPTWSLTLRIEEE
jgi:hypothetical protein